MLSIPGIELITALCGIVPVAVLTGSTATPRGVKLSIDVEAVCLDAGIMRREPCNHRRMGGIYRSRTAPFLRPGGDREPAQTRPAPPRHLRNARYRDRISVAPSSRSCYIEDWRTSWIHPSARKIYGTWQTAR